MRFAPLAMALVLFATGSAPAAPNTEKVKVKVKVKVVRGCTVHAPTAKLTTGAGTVPVIALGSLLSDCTADDIPAQLTIVRDPADNRTDVATINF